MNEYKWWRCFLDPCKQYKNPTGPHTFFVKTPVLDRDIVSSHDVNILWCFWFSRLFLHAMFVYSSIQRLYKDISPLNAIALAVLEWCLSPFSRIRPAIHERHFIHLQDHKFQKYMLSSVKSTQYGQMKLYLVTNTPGIKFNLKRHNCWQQKLKCEDRPNDDGHYGDIASL